MEDITWPEAVEIIMPHIFRISTPRGWGSGFLLSNGKNNTLCAIATAAHVIDQAHAWEEPIRLEHSTSKNSILVHAKDRAIIKDNSCDTAAIIIDRGDMSIPKDALKLAPREKQLKIANEIAWLGFPAITTTNLCYFSGRVSSWLSDENGNLSGYLVDGVSINGVSGGPAFHMVGNIVLIMGVVSAYIPNRATGEPLPGLAVVRNVNQLHNSAAAFQSLDQARKAEPS